MRFNGVDEFGSVGAGNVLQEGYCWATDSFHQLLVYIKCDYAGFILNRTKLKRTKMTRL